MNIWGLCHHPYFPVSNHFIIPSLHSNEENIANTEGHTITTSAPSLTQRPEDVEFLLLSKVCSSKAAVTVFGTNTMHRTSVLNTGLWADHGQAELELSQDRNNRKNNTGDSPRCGSRKGENRIETQNCNNCQSRADFPMRG